jgi:hypothetical protein
MMRRCRTRMHRPKGTHHQEEVIDPSPACRTCDESDREDPEEDSEEDSEEEGAHGPVPEFKQPQLGEELEDEDEGHDIPL